MNESNNASCRSTGDFAAQNPELYEAAFADYDPARVLPTIDCPCCLGDGCDLDDPRVVCQGCGGIGVIPDERPAEPEPTDAEIEAMALAAADLLDTVAVEF